MTSWSTEHFLPWRKKLRWVEKCINEIQNENTLGMASQYEQNLIETHQHLLRVENVYWRQRSTNAHQQDGDRNTKYFHTAARIRKATNHIHTITKEYGSTVRDDKEIQDAFITYFERLMSARPPSAPRTPTSSYHPMLRKLSPQQVENLQTIPTEE